MSKKKRKEEICDWLFVDPDNALAKRRGGGDLDRV